MPFSNEIRAGASGAQSTEFYSHTIDQSLRLDNASGAYLTIAAASPTATNRKKVAISCWVKRSGISKSGVCTVFWSTVNGLMLQFFTADNIYIYDNNAGGWQSTVTNGGRIFRDTGAWYHLALIIDTTQSTEADRAKFYINGELQTLNSYPSENSDITWHTGSTLRIGSVGDSQDLNGYIAEFISIDGQDVSISDFGETKDGIWVPKDVSGLTLGNAGFYLDFSDSNYIGKSVGSKTLVTSPSFSTFGGGDTNFTAAEYAKGFDGKVSTTCDRTGSGGIIEFTPSSAVTPTSHTMINAASVAYSAASRPNSVLLQGSNDGGDNWTTIDDLTNGSGANAVTTSTFSNTTSYAKLRLNISENHGGTNTRFSEYIVMASDNNGDGDIIFFNNGNLDSTDIMPDSPTNNFAIMNELFVGNSAVIKDGGLEVETGGFSSSLYGTVSTFAIPKDKKIYIEVEDTGATGDNWTAGFVTNTSLINGPSSNNIGSSGSIMAYNRSVLVNGTETDYGSSAGLGGLGVAKLAAGDILGCMIDGETGKVWFSRNGSYFKSPSTDNSGTTGDPDGGNHEIGTLTGGTTDDVFFVVSGGTSANDVFVNFGQDSQNVSSANADANGIGTFEYAPPTNYVSLCASNLTDTELGPNKSEQATDHYNTLLWTGDGNTNRAITGVGFTPDWLWLKCRSNSEDHCVEDTVRGAGNKIEPNNDGNTDTTATAVLTSHDADGFTGPGSTPGNLNVTDRTYVGWFWKAGGAPTATNSAGAGNVPTTGSVMIDGVASTSSLAGSLPATKISANTKSGFSIVQFTGTGSNATIAHGLTSAPDVCIIKKTSGTGNWFVYTRAENDQASDEAHVGYFNLSTAAFAASAIIFNDTPPTDTVFSVGTGNANNNTATYIAYLFHEVEGFSKFGRFAGNSAAAGTFVHCGFKPARIWLRQDATGIDWTSYDLLREGFNVENDSLRFAAATEQADDDLDILSNGFKMRRNMANNQGDVMFFAWADSPFKYSNAR